ncbi:10 transmembrane domain, possible aa transporter, putative [Perkinsus marinus ATCC 50983]|uniref:10 transmembrane domain, possible aa transporter, putative n=1 Tax=Perkinsus marinus (strain ATCC 50983 / TXsc) TaxID=423536 RepID=C5LWJ5_PERM5|nr:10 transmembrane domain, possible aa transporter, putative [Perkinsus marinus ATCC 50983]EEQ98908.1 10 transmembrane domain, possible aa transporter, putative [Perkinsus marinus ATCC 50983]|eukprot:XP_002766191.1 10 transmembrane domain, possible aa transporter, putative [Perkinsus marinus ATCC 50983]
MERLDSSEKTQGPSQSQFIQGKCSNVRAVLSIVLSAIGLGVVMLPSILAASGWIGGILVVSLGCVFALFALSRLYLGITLTPSSKGPVYTYEELGRVCFGKAGFIFTAIVVHLTMAGLCASLLVLLGENTTKLIPALSQRIWIVIWAVFFIPFTFLRTMHEVSYVAAVGMVSILTLFIIISANGLMVGLTSHEEVEHDMFVADVTKLATNFGVSILAYNTTNSTATLVRDMSQPKRFVPVSRVAYVMIYTIYVAIGICGYYGYGRALLERPILDLIVPPGDAVSGVWAYITIIAILLTAIPHYVVLLLPIVSSAEYVFHIPVDDNSRPAALRRFLVRLGCIVFTAIIAVSVPNLSSLLDLVGSVTMVFMVAMMPCIYYVRVRQMNEGSLGVYVRKHKLESFIIVVVLIWCIPMIIIGTYGAVQHFG